MKVKSRYNEESALANSGKWKILRWLWDNIEHCPDVDSVSDLGAVEGTMTFLSANGEEYTLTITKGNWREL